MLHRTKIFAAILSVTCAALIHNAAAAQDDAKPTTGRESFFITDDEWPKLVNEALSGSGPAAMRLLNYNRIVTTAPEKAAYWAKVAAENGHPSGYWEYALVLLKSSDQQDNLRALYWLGKARDSGQEPIAKFARDELKRLQK
jgi:TPR repeat protein